MLLLLVAALAEPWKTLAATPGQPWMNLSATLEQPWMTQTATPEQPWMNVSATPEQRAALLLADLTLEEKLHFFHGSGSGYTGNVAAQRGGAIPALKMNDGPQGFRAAGHDGTSTAWPSALAVSATFNTATAKAWGVAMGEEFFAKGSNVQLGPGVCVARVPRNGRNFEYLSGEDPMLGATIVVPVVTGIQSQKVIANVKHFVNNNQETNRLEVSENVDERTQFEIYYPPFEAAAKAGVGSVMCSYNKIRGTWSCENPETLQRDLKERLGFKGWVMSDWGGTHSTSMTAGLDQEMPGSDHMGAQLAALVASGEVTQAKVDDSTLRVLTPMFQMGLFDEPWISNVGSLESNVTSTEHNKLARSIAAEGIVLLKNSGVLPITATKNFTIAIIGEEARDPQVRGGGSGQVVPYYVSSPLAAMYDRFGIVEKIDLDSMDWKPILDDGCNSIDKEECWMGTDNQNIAEDNVISSRCNTAGVCISYDPGTDTTTAAMVAAEADIALVFVATNSNEGADRVSLSFDYTSFDGNNDKLVAAVAAANKNTVVVGVAPGAVLTPWRDNAAAILLAFLPGQEYGNAVTDVLLGAVNPSGKLPLTLPTKENECPEFSTDMWPGSHNAAQANYSEHLLIGYRCYDHFGIEPAFPFGHGLSYTTFALTGLKVSANGSRISVLVANTGRVAGQEVVQLYLSFPATAAEPPQQLKRFEAVTLGAGQSRAVTFSMDRRDVSVWDVGRHRWVEVGGTFGVSVGTSSRDRRALKGSFVTSG